MVVSRIEGFLVDDDHPCSSAQAYERDRNFRRLCREQRAIAQSLNLAPDGKEDAKLLDKTGHGTSGREHESTTNADLSSSGTNINVLLPETPASKSAYLTREKPELVLTASSRSSIKSVVGTTKASRQDNRRIRKKANTNGLPQSKRGKVPKPTAIQDDISKEKCAPPAALNVKVMNVTSKLVHPNTKTVPDKKAEEDESEIDTDEADDEMETDEDEDGTEILEGFDLPLSAILNDDSEDELKKVPFRPQKTHGKVIQIARNHMKLRNDVREEFDALMSQWKKEYEKYEKKEIQPEVVSPPSLELLKSALSRKSATVVDSKSFAANSANVEQRNSKPGPALNLETPKKSTKRQYNKSIEQEVNVKRLDRERPELGKVSSARSSIKSTSRLKNQNGNRKSTLNKLPQSKRGKTREQLPKKQKDTRVESMVHDEKMKQSVETVEKEHKNRKKAERRSPTNAYIKPLRVPICTDDGLPYIGLSSDDEICLSPILPFKVQKAAKRNARSGIEIVEDAIRVDIDSDDGLSYIELSSDDEICLSPILPFKVQKAAERSARSGIKIVGDTIRVDIDSDDGLSYSELSSDYDGLCFSPINPRKFKFNDKTEIKGVDDVKEDNTLQTETSPSAGARKRCIGSRKPDPTETPVKKFAQSPSKQAELIPYEEAMDSAGFSDMLGTTGPTTPTTVDSPALDEMSKQLQWIALKDLKTQQQFGPASIPDMEWEEEPIGLAGEQEEMPEVVDSDVDTILEAD